MPWGTYPAEKVWGVGVNEVNVPWFGHMKGCAWQEFGPEAARDEGFRRRF